jgi:NADPH-dependent 2,4-dienoyl-CoA reductase/sulfur reductase-like enzyme
VFHESEVDSISIERNEVLLSGGVLPYAVLVVATGARLQPEEAEGLTGPGWNERVFTFFETRGASALQRALERFDGGRVVVKLVDMPIKCPVAPLEFAFLADWFFRRRAIRDRVELVYSTPLDGAFTKPLASQHLAGLLAEKEIELVTEFRPTASGESSSPTTAELDFELLVKVPLHGGAAFVDRSPGVGDALGFVPTDRRTRQTLASPDVFALGDTQPTCRRRRRLGDALRSGRVGGECRLLPRPLGARPGARRPCKLLRRDRLPESAPDRFQLRHGAASGSLPVRGGPASAPRVTSQSRAGLPCLPATVDMFGLTMDDFVPHVRDIISVGELYELAGGGENIFT